MESFASTRYFLFHNDFTLILERKLYFKKASLLQKIALESNEDKKTIKQICLQYTCKCENINRFITTSKVFLISKRMFFRLSVYNLSYWSKTHKQALLTWPWVYFDTFSLKFTKEMGLQFWETIENLLQNRKELTESQCLLLVLL
jgi:hypothetical protein